MPARPKVRFFACNAVGPTVTGDRTGGDSPTINLPLGGFPRLGGNTRLCSQPTVGDVLGAGTHLPNDPPPRCRPLGIAGTLQDVVSGVVVPIELDQTASPRGLAELQEASEAVTLLRKIRLPFAKLVLEPGHERQAVPLLEVGYHLAQQCESGVFFSSLGREPHFRVALGGALSEFDYLPLLEVAKQLAECTKPVVWFAERRVLSQHGPFDRRSEHRAPARPLQAGQGLGDQRRQIIQRSRGGLAGSLRTGFGGRFGGSLTPFVATRKVNALQAVVEQELVTGWG